jgi:putative ABC transport system permease protein
MASAVSESQIDAAREQINQVLISKRRGASGDGTDYTIRTQTDISEMANQTSRTLSVLLAAIACVSLVVGGIGIMNIMLVSVTERTREIGLRMAVGGRRRDILLQFLVEAVTLCMLGGIIGVVIGVSAAAIVAASAKWPILIAADAILMALAAAALTGIVFGFFPARRAAHLNPIDALRSE